MKISPLIKRVLAWSLLLGSAVASFVLAVFLANRNIGGAIVIANRDWGLLENWTLALMALAIGGCIYLLRGLYGNVWSASATALGGTAGAALLLLLFGEYGLLALAGGSAIVAPLLIRKRQSGI